MSDCNTTIRDKLNKIFWNKENFYNTLCELEIFVEYPEIESFKVETDQEYNDSGDYCYYHSLEDVEFVSKEAELALYKRIFGDEELEEDIPSDIYTWLDELRSNMDLEFDIECGLTTYYRPENAELALTEHLHNTYNEIREMFYD